MWVYCSGVDSPSENKSNNDIKNIALYDYQPIRAGSCAVNYLNGFNGYLQADGYQGYGQVDLNPVRAKITEQLEASKNTSIKKRLGEIKTVDPLDVQTTFDSAISAITNQINGKKLSVSLKGYIELVEWTGLDKTLFTQIKHQCQKTFRCA